MRVHPVYFTIADLRQAAANLWTKPINLSHRSAKYHHLHLMLIVHSQNQLFTAEKKHLKNKTGYELNYF